VAQGALAWEMVTGAQGTLAVTPQVATDMPGFSPTSYYLDDSTPPVTQCTGDAFAYGSSGLWVNQDIPNTDPYLGAHYHLEAGRVIAYAGPNRDAAFAEACAAEAANPIVFETAPYEPTTDVADRPVPNAGAFLTLSCWPNPANRTLSMRLTTELPGTVSVALFDVAGRRMMHLFVGSIRVGAHDLSRDVSSLPAGVYFVRASGPLGMGPTQRVVIVR
jgi:hypothetical protein